MLKKCLKNKKLKKVVLLISVFLVSFFNINVYAANFKYKDFDFDIFAKHNLGFWTSHCSGNSKDVENCTEETLETQRQFYTRLYKILAKYEKKGLNIRDDIIIATVFFELNLDMFNDDGQSYKDLNNTDKSPYNYDKDDNLDFYDPDNDTEEAANYFASEVDTLKLLIKSMVGYETKCIGYTEGRYESREVTYTDEEGIEKTKTESILVCDKGRPTNGLTDHEVCSDVLETGLVGFWEKFASKINFFGIKSEGEKNCITDVQNAGYSEHKYHVERSQTVNVDYYWKFLTEGDYFDKKPHLQYYFANVLSKTNHENMWDLEDPEKEEHEEEIKAARQKIVDNIKEILETYNGYEIDEMSFSKANGVNYWWPIGSVNTTIEEGKTFALDEPESSSIYRNYGYSYNEIDQTYSDNYGIDIIANSVAGQTNIIAANNGTVYEVVNNCASGDNECGSGYGNYVVILHANGIYTKYAHLHEGSITVQKGDSVKQGEVIGKMGDTGKTDRVLLYFEVRTGRSKTSTVNPTDYVNINNPRPVSSSEDIINMLLGLEGTGPISGNNYIVYCNKDDVPTVGPGITLTYNYDKFAQMGYPLKSSNRYNNYCGQPIPIDLVDQIFGLVLNEYSESIKMELAMAGIELDTHQIDALLSLKYNCGNINGFINAYNIYGNSNSLCTSWWIDKASGGTYSSTLRKRRQKECNLFVNGVYDGTYS